MEWIAVILALGFGILAGWKISAKKTAALTIRNAALEQENRLMREACDRDIAAEKENSRRMIAEQEKILTVKLDLIKAEFRTLSERIFTEKSEAMQKNNSQQITALLTPLREKMSEFRNSVENAREKGVEQSAKLTEQISKMMEETRRIGSEANALASALKGEQKTQGNWGEMILEDLLTRSGLQRDVHYEIQPTIRDDGGKTLRTEENKMLRPDVILHYPDGKDIIIDSKVSLTAYAVYMNSSEDPDSSDALQRHEKSLRAHVEELVRKNYAGHLKKNGRETVDFVIMFIPNEGSFLLGMKNSPSLWQEAFERKVIIVSPLHLATLLHLIHIAWTRSDQNRNQEEILTLANQMLDRIYAFYADFDEIGLRIDKLHDAYGSALKRLKHNPGGRSIISSGEQLRRLGVKLSKKQNIPPRLAVETDEEFSTQPIQENTSIEDDKSK
jgi:DNA recombination protein RmuC